MEWVDSFIGWTCDSDGEIAKSKVRWKQRPGFNGDDWDDYPKPLPGDPDTHFPPRPNYRKQLVCLPPSAATSRRRDKLHAGSPSNPLTLPSVSSYSKAPLCPLNPANRNPHLHPLNHYRPIPEADFSIAFCSCPDGLVSAESFSADGAYSARITS